jgi:hypothetical protein
VKTKKPETKKKPVTKNVTHEKLSGLPFKSARHWKEAQDAVLMQVWRRMEEAKVINELVKRPEYSFWHEEFREGLVCAYGEKSDVNLVRVFSEGNGIKIQINRSLADAAPSAEQVLGALVRAMSESFAATYYRAKGILAASDVQTDEAQTGTVKGK